MYGVRVAVAVEGLWETSAQRIELCVLNGAHVALSKVSSMKTTCFVEEFKPRAVRQHVPGVIT